MQNRMKFWNKPTARGAVEIDQYLSEIGLSPEELFENVLSANEEIYSKENFKKLAQAMPQSRRELEPLLGVPIASLGTAEKITVLLSSICCLKKKADLMVMKRTIRLALHHMKLILVWAILSSEIIKRKDFVFVAMLITQIAEDEGINFPPFRFRMLPLRTADGSVFMDNIVMAVTSSDHDYTQFSRESTFTDEAVHVPPISAIRKSLREMGIDILKMEEVLEKIHKVPTHPDDNFYNIMKIFVAESKNNIRAFFRMTDNLEEEFENLCQLYSISENSMPIGIFFDEAVALARMFRQSALRVE